MDHMTNGNKIEKLKDVVVPREYTQRILLGVKGIDEAFGGPNPGIVAGSSMMFTGQPGAGKSTLCLQMAELFQIASCSVLYNLGEENRYAIRQRGERLGIQGGFSVGQIEDVNELIASVVDGCYGVLLQDSLQTLRDGDLTGPTLLKSCARKLHELSHDKGIVVIIVGQVNKANVFAGPQEVKHTFDAHAHLSVDKNGRRFFELQKNRNGPAFVKFECSLDKYGMSFGKNEKIDGYATLADCAYDEMINGQSLENTEFCLDRLGIKANMYEWSKAILDASKRLDAEDFLTYQMTYDDGTTSTYVLRFPGDPEGEQL